MFSLAIAIVGFVQSVNPLQTALDFRSFISSEVKTGTVGRQLDGNLLRTSEGDQAWSFQFEDCTVTVNKRTGRIGFSTPTVTNEPADPSWAELLIPSDSELLAVISKFYQKAGYEGHLVLLQKEQWGGDGLPSGGTQRYWRLLAGRLFGEVRTSRRVTIEFNVDADTFQLLAMDVATLPLPPANLVPRVSHSEATAIAMARYFGVDPTLELGLQRGCSLCIWDPRNTLGKEMPGDPPDIVAAMRAGRGILAYEMGISDVRHYPPGEGPTAYVVVDARNGRILYAAELSRGLGAGDAKTTTARRWGPGPFAIMSGGTFKEAKHGWLTTVQPEFKPEPGRTVTLRSGQVVFQAEFHPKEGLLSRNASMGAIYAKPNAQFSLALRFGNQIHNPKQG